MTNRESGCGYGDQVTGYIYGELNESERAIFSGHLESCDACSGEIESLKTVIGAIGEWKSNVFDNFETPAIVVPQAATTGSKVPESSALHRLREFFGVTPLMFKTAAGFAAILIAAGIVWISLDYAFEIDVSENGPAPVLIEREIQNEKPVLADNKESEVDRETAAEDTPATTPLQESSPQKPVIASNRSDDVDSPERTIRKPAKPGTRPVKSPFERTPPGSEPRDGKGDAIPPVERLTVLADSADTEDESLRLTELFAIADSDER
ncbi:MAG: zf-HC2 domain-containing protein [Acidobacteriota bacterium]|nr:zf-HC2 domain-containing protein [Acidobacteriota bacterium]